MSCNEWNTVKLGELIESVSVRHKFDNDKIIFLNTSDILDGCVLHNNYSDVDGLPGQAKKSIRRDDILFSEIRPKNKRFAYIDFDAQDYVVSTKLMVLRKKDNRINNKFLYKFLTSEKTLEYLQTIAESRSGTFPQITFNELKIMDIELPPLEEQERIANILSSLDDKIELNNEMNKTLEEMAKTLFKRWFADFEFPNEDGKPYKSSGGEMVESELGMIPKGWEVGTLDNIGTFKNGKTIKQELRNDNGKNLIYGSNGIIGKTNEVLQDNNCIIIGRVGAYCGSVQLSLESCWVTDNAIMGIANKKEYLPYLHRFLLNYPLRESAGGSAQPLINQSILKSIRTVIAPQNLLEKYYNISNKILLKIDENNKENIILSDLRDSILPKLISGEIKVQIV